jgi:hypothetical protein
MTIAGRTFSGAFDLKADPDSHFTQADYQASHDFSEHFGEKLSALDVGLNSLDDVKAALDKARTAASAKNDSAAVSAIDAAIAGHQNLQDDLTANFQNFEDFVQRPGKLREDLSGVAGGVGLLTPAILDAGRRIDREYASGASAFNAYVATLPALNATLKSGGYTAVPVPKPIR